MKDYFARAKPENAAWALYFLSGRQPKQIVPSKKLKEWAIELAEIIFKDLQNFKTSGEQIIKPPIVPIRYDEPNGNAQNLQPLRDS